MNPLQIEREYEALRRHLALVASPRMRMSLILRFLSPLVTSSHNVVSAYLYELLPEWSRLASKVSLLGSRLEFVVQAIALTQNLFDISARDNEIGTALENLIWQEKCILDALARRSQIFPYQNEGTEYTFVPLVEYERLKSQSEPQFARVVRLSLEIRSVMQKGMGDCVNLRSLTGSVQGDELGVIDALKAAKDVLLRLGSRKLTSSLHVDVDIDGPGSMTGSSSGLAVGLLLVSKLLRKQESRNEFLPSFSIAYTGGLAATGEVLPVDPVGLRCKIESCFFSEIRTLVVPEVQVIEARQHAEHLRQNAPVESRLEILGAAHLEDLFHDRRMTVQKRISMPRRAVRKAWIHRRPLALGLVIVLCLTIAKLLYGPLDKIAASTVVEGSFIMVRNARGEVLDSVRVGAFESAYKRDFFKSRENGCGLKILGDADGNGQSEVIWADDVHSDDRGLSMICCKRVGMEGTLWSTDLRQFIGDFPEHPETKSSPLSIQKFVLVDADSDGKEEVYALANQHYFPSVIARIDARTGIPEAWYVHAGHLMDITAIDMNDDGIKEIIACGANQGFKTAVMIVLDPRRMSGCAPTSDRYRISGVRVADHVAYVSLPRSIVGETVSVDRSNWGMRFLANSSDSILTVVVADGFFSTPQGQDQVAALEFSFDSQLHCVSIGSQSTYDRLAEQLYSKGLIKIIPDKKYFDGLGKVIGYWDGAKFSTAPTQ